MCLIENKIKRKREGERERLKIVIVQMFKDYSTLPHLLFLKHQMRKQWREKEWKNIPNDELQLSWNKSQTRVFFHPIFKSKKEKEKREKKSWNKKTEFQIRVKVSNSLELPVISRPLSLSERRMNAIIIHLENNDSNSPSLLVNVSNPFLRFNSQSV